MRRIAAVLLFAMGIVGLGVLVWAQPIPSRLPIVVQFTLLVVGAACVVVGLSGIEHYRPKQTRGNINLPLLCIILLAFAARLWQLQDGMRVLVDETNPLRTLLDMWDYPIPLLYPTEPLTLPVTWTYSSFQNTSVQILGTNLIGFRFVSVIAGVLLVPAVYSLTLELFQKKGMALVASSAAASLPLAIHFSRIGLNNIVDPLIGTLALLFILRGWKYQSQPDWVLGGAFLATTYYYWEAGARFYTPFVVLWLGWCTLWDRKSLMRNGRGILLGIATYIILASPVWITWDITDAAALSRYNSSGLSAPAFVDILTSTASDAVVINYLRGIADAFLVLVVIPETSAFYGGNQPFLLWFVSPFALIGLFVALRYMRKPESLILWWAVAIPTANGLLLVETAHAARFMNVIPPLVILIALGVYAVARVTPRRAATAVIVTVILGVGQVRYYYGIHLPQFNVMSRGTSGDAVDAMFRASELPNGIQVVLVQPEVAQQRYGNDLVRFLTNDQREPVTLTMTTGEFIEWLSGDHLQALAVFVEPDDIAAQQAIMEEFGDIAYRLSDEPIPLDNQFRMYAISLP